MSMSSVRTDEADAGGGWPYDPIQRSFHWLVVLMLAAQYSVALWLDLVLPKSAEDDLIAWHFGLGSSVAVVMVLRLWYRLTHPVPPAPTDLSPPLRLLARATHWTFYAGYIVLPFLGWLAANGHGAQVKLAGLIPLPQLVPKDDPLGVAMRTIHPTVALILLAVVALHISGALYHALVKRDGVAGRMVPGLH